tara:strand:- start:3981 stop:5387 length:1407 start_codon:yes stop_codon:yes gene_type:complete
MRKEVLRHLYASTKTIYEQLPDPTGGADDLAQFVGDVALSTIKREPKWRELSQEVERSMLDSTRLSKIEKSRLIRNIMSLFNERLFERTLPDEQEFAQFVSDNNIEDVGLEHNPMGIPDISSRNEKKKVDFFVKGAYLHIWDSILRDRDEWEERYTVTSDVKEIAQDLFDRKLKKLTLEILGKMSEFSRQADRDNLDVDGEINLRRTAIPLKANEAFKEALANDSFLSSLDDKEKEKVLDTFTSMLTHHFLEEATDVPDRDEDEEAYEITWAKNFFDLLVKKSRHFGTLATQMARTRKESPKDAIQSLLATLPIYMDQSQKKDANIRRWAKSRLNEVLSRVSDEDFESAVEAAADKRHAFNRGRRMDSLPQLSNEVFYTFQDAVQILANRLIKKSVSASVFETLTNRVFGTQRTRKLVKDLAKISFKGVRKKFLLRRENDMIVEKILAKGKYKDKHYEEDYELFRDED